MYTMLGLTGIGTIAAFAARWAQTALADRLDVLNAALNATPDAQMVLAEDGSMVHANLAFDRLFPGTGEPPLNRIECSVATDPESISEFSGYVAGLRLGSAPLLKFLYGMRAEALAVGSSFRQARLPGAPDTAFGKSAPLLHAATL